MSLIAAGEESGPKHSRAGSRRAEGAAASCGEPDRIHDLEADAVGRVATALHCHFMVPLR